TSRRQRQMCIRDRLEAGKCKPLIYASYPMAEIAKAHACLDSGQHLGKVVITMTS
ncbi:NAD(P)H-quinone oxidoreductase, partial [Klebsiella pneumoniae]|nr:NAD(P)H-quinone oxidoreductase [Klebsiella pneumoniae]